jgi:hypothetical protein
MICGYFTNRCVDVYGAGQRADARRCNVTRPLFRIVRDDKRRPCCIACGRRFASRQAVWTHFGMMHELPKAARKRTAS